MIYFPKDITAVPGCPGYFWDTVKHQLYSIKTGGVLRELKLQRIHGAMLRYRGFQRFTVGQPYYQVSVNGYRRYLAVSDLKKLTLVDYDIPVVSRAKETVQ